MKCLLDSDLCSILLSLIVLISFISPKVHRDLAKGIMRYIRMVIIIIIIIIISSAILHKACIPIYKSKFIQQTLDITNSSGPLKLLCLYQGCRQQKIDTKEI